MIWLLVLPSAFIPRMCCAGLQRRERQHSAFVPRKTFSTGAEPLRFQSKRKRDVKERTRASAPRQSGKSRRRAYVISGRERRGRSREADMMTISRITALSAVMASVLLAALRPPRPRDRARCADISLARGARPEHGAPGTATEPGACASPHHHPPRRGRCLHAASGKRTLSPARTVQRQ